MPGDVCQAVATLRFRRATFNSADLSMCDGCKEQLTTADWSNCTRVHVSGFLCIVRHAHITSEIAIPSCASFMYGHGITTAEEDRGGTAFLILTTVWLSRNHVAYAFLPGSQGITMETFCNKIFDQVIVKTFTDAASQVSQVSFVRGKYLPFCFCNLH